ncbi:hypothetical protein BC936DRAFT_137435 [Jimgerdemannia flammicorona]|uniref:Uncharacterized protein n=2 Tax=Jimgerdemannia flammicorona TaxID=994334 RepID=A0A433Q3S0_9FUNG|nr:hypothetical protein BC936DRAFT_137435 [Jimgerdemannia flammicorona]RUS24440.1 hypothetical protein BC938DRAFT_473577 [Jimgerdemannia flammicorona]
MTLARHLKTLLPNTVIVHQDDFFKVRPRNPSFASPEPPPTLRFRPFPSQPEKDIPIDPATNLINWDCPSALDFPALVRLLHHARAAGGTLPDTHDSKEDRNIPTNPPVAVREDRMLTFQNSVYEILGGSARDAEDGWAFVIVDGFMLYWDEEVMRELDIRVFVRGAYETLKRRREERQGYVTIEGYWVDPPGYFDSIVWPEYLKWNGHLFTGQDHSSSLHAGVRGVTTLNSDEQDIEEMVRVSLEALKVVVKQKE